VLARPSNLSVLHRLPRSRAKPFTDSLASDHIGLQLVPDHVGASATLTNQAHAAAEQTFD
jgi:hypothetical protein